MQNVFNKRKEEINEFNTLLEELNLRKKNEEVSPKEVPDDLMCKCPSCGKNLFKADYESALFVCPSCGYNARLYAKDRLKMIMDEGFKELFTDIAENHLDFPGYVDKLNKAQAQTQIDESIICVDGKIEGISTLVGVMDSHFIMGSMGSVCGEKITRLCELAIKMHRPVILFTCSGGARMQEGIISLMQMAKTSAAIKRHGEAGLLYATILTDPTTGGVTASFAMLGDVIMAEPGALIGFAGPRVIKQTLGQRLPDGFQTAEFLQEHGFVDGIVRRENLKKTLYFLITTHRCSEGNYADFKKNFDFHFEPTEIVKERSILTLPRTAWEKVKTVRRVDRPAATDYIPYIFDYVVEAHGDRYYGDDKALVGAVAFLDGQPVTVLADVKGKDFAECARRNYGMPMPEGYRKALRLMKQAEKFNRPIISFVNTPGAFCGVEAEERGQGEAIARNLLEMSALKVPVLCILIGEGGSGGALATAVGNEVWMMENATYSILSPEGFASILWKDADRAREASEVMNITSEDLKRLGVIERIVPEYGGADQSTVEAIGGYLKEHIKEFLQKYTGMTGEQIAEERYERFRKY